jgi:UDP-glucose 4-epimerase
MTDTKTILVTGGAGFVGSHLCERLASAGHRVISFDNYFTGSRANHVAGVEYRTGHTKDIARHVPESPDVVYHLGEYARTEKSFEDIEIVWDFNKTGTFAVLAFVRERGSKIVYAGSSTKFSDAGRGRDQSPYAWSKATNTELVKNYGAWFGIPYAITYFYNVYGGRERGRGAYATLIGIFKEQYRAGEPLTVVMPGTQVRNFTHIDDTVDALVMVGERGAGDEYGIGNERGYSVAQVAALFGAEVIMVPARKGNRQTSMVDTTKLAALGWKPRRSLEDDIAAFTASVPRGSSKPERRVLVFSTTFHPVEGPAEKALVALMKSLPDVRFDVVTTTFSRSAADAPSPVPNAVVHRVGWGTPFDKFLLPILGVGKARELQKKNRYLFMWSVMASYGGLAAALSKRASSLPLLVTLADQRTRRSSLKKAATSFVMSRADVGSDDAFANAVSVAYGGFLSS